MMNFTLSRVQAGFYTIWYSKNSFPQLLFLKSLYALSLSLLSTFIDDENTKSYF